ncbi:MAG TPA: nuclear transport factor 2 family protein [Vicinamibacterales bacterium]
MNPFAGTWTANIEKSRRHPNHQFESAMLRFDVSGDEVSVTHSGVNASGKLESGTTVLRADGEEHPVSPLAPGVVAVTRWLGANALETVARKDGQVVGLGKYELSSDRRTLTVTVSGTDAAGKPFEQVIVFDSPPEQERLLQAFADAWNAHDVDALMAMMTGDCVFEASSGPTAGGERHEGERAVRSAYAAVFEQYPDAHWGHARHFVSGERGVSEWTFTGTLADGTRIEVNGCDLLTFRNDKIAVKNSFRKNRPPI